jgi:hypothetical protein
MQLREIVSNVCHAVRARLHMNAQDRFAQGPQIFEAEVAKRQAELIFAFCVEGTTAFVAG